MGFKWLGLVNQHRKLIIQLGRRHLGYASWLPHKIEHIFVFLCIYSLNYETSNNNAMITI